MLIAPSILASDFGNLQQEIQMVNESEADWIHVDIMDGVFVNNISFGFPILEVLQKQSKKPLDVHLMIVEPERYIESFVTGGANVLSVHLEACPNLHRTLSKIKNLGCQTGIAINLHSPVSLLEDILHMADIVCMMGVDPGFGGQKLMGQTFSRCERLKELILKNNTDTLIEIDGGVNGENAERLKKSGADILVAGNYVFKSEKPAETLSFLKHL
jgi:ribulose-phosphate 3-epimerase